MKKLRLNPTTIRILASTDLRQVAGGETTDRTQSGLNCPAQESVRPVTRGTQGP